jgi:Hint domain
MSLSDFYYARVDNGTAQNDAVNVNGGDVYTLQFTAPTWQDLSLTYVPDGNDVGTTPDFDPNTQVIINGITYNFAVLKAGTLPVASVPTDLQGKIVYVIEIDFDQDGDLEGKGDLQLFFTTDPAGTSANMALIGNGALTLGNVNLTPPPEPVCFCAGTLIETPSGQRKVESLCAGDMVLTAMGEPRQVMWVGSTRIPAATLRQNPHLRPIIIPAGSLGHGSPATDLKVSPQHRVMIEHGACALLFGEEAVLVPAKFLVGPLADVAEVAGDVVYFHVLLQDHDMLLSNGLPTESFQPARRMIDVMGEAARTTLVAVLAALGEDQMLARKDSLRSLRQHEARVLVHWLERHAPSGLVGPNPDRHRFH